MRLRNSRYEEIKKSVVKLYSELCVHCIPVDCFEICEKLHIRLVPYSSEPTEKRKVFKFFSKDGFSYLTMDDEWVIYYDDTMPNARIRFTIMHEIGHIVLDHTEHSDLAESEANFFAQYALAAPPLIHCIKPEDYMDIAREFNISKECALYAMGNYHNWLRYGASYMLDYEIALISLFDEPA